MQYNFVCFTSHRQRGHLETPPPPHLLSLANDVKLGFYTVPTGNRTPGRCAAVCYTTVAPRQPPPPQCNILARSLARINDTIASKESNYLYLRQDNHNSSHTKHIDTRSMVCICKHYHFDACFNDK